MPMEKSMGTVRERGRGREKQMEMEKFNTAHSHIA